MTDIERRFNVSRETVEKLKVYAGLLKKWNPKINLVSPASLKDLENRHIMDSLQLWSLRGSARSWVDLGSGGGFPGMVIALANAAENAGLDVTLVESDARKSAFLRTVSRETSSKVDVVNARIEEADIGPADVVSARALAALPQLLDFTHGLLASGGYALYLKGRTCDEEIESAQRVWQFDFEKIASATDPQGVILKVWNIKRASE